ncbi:hypothetical protein GCM10010439_15930 [Actinocorallia aurantiaca]|uniref:Uncharacterized protein n=1 Tax=Actinocorallia aurantiaca TaxID=46204 RepID=A0ABN3U1H5_9ACTN
MTSQPAGSGQVSQIGTLACALTTASPSSDGLAGGWSGRIEPCSAQVQSADLAFGGTAVLPQRGQVGSGLTLTHSRCQGPSSQDSGTHQLPQESLLEVCLEVRAAWVRWSCDGKSC